MAKKPSGFLMKKRDGELNRVLSYVKVFLWNIWGFWDYLSEVPYEVMLKFVSETPLEKLVTYVETRDCVAAFKPLESQRISLIPDKVLVVFLKFEYSDGEWKAIRTKEITGVFVVEGESGGNPFSVRQLEKAYCYGASVLKEEKTSGNASSLRIVPDGDFEDVIPVDIISVWPATSQKYRYKSAYYAPTLTDGFNLDEEDCKAFDPKVINLKINVPGPDPDKVAENPDKLSPRKKRDYIVLRLLSVVLTNAEDWDDARKAEVLKKEYGFTDEDDLLEEGDIKKVGTLLEVIEKQKTEIAKKDDEIAQLKTDNDKKDKEIKDLKAEVARMRADRSSPLPA